MLSESYKGFGPAPTSAQPDVVPPERFATEPEIGQAVGQLNAGQPVTALPKQSWSFPQQESFNAKLDQFDQQAKAARKAAEQAALDAQMFQQMSRVAKSVKDIEIAKRSIDMMGLQRDIQSGVPIHEAVQRHPMGLGSGFGGALRATAQPGKASWVEPAGGAPGHFQLPSGGVSVPTIPTAPMEKPTVENLGPGVEGVRTSPNRYQLTKTPSREGALTNVEQSRLSDIARQETDIRTTLRGFGPKQLKPTNERYVAATNQLAVLKAERDAILAGAGGAAAPAAKTPAIRVVRDPKSKTGFRIVR